MKVFPNEEQNLYDFLLSYRNRSITIVSAFVSGIQDHLREMLDNGNTVSLYTGVLMGFNNPKELRSICEMARNVNYYDEFKFYVNFSESTSSHWKLYLASPNQVIIGSSNYTRVGLLQSRDSTLLVKNHDVYTEFFDRIDGDDYVDAIDDIFLDKLMVYEQSYRKIKYHDSNFEWNQTIPVFVWGHYIPEEQKNDALDAYNENCPSPNLNINRNAVRDFFSYDSSLTDYREGDCVLCIEKTGKNIGFYTFDRIVQVGDTKYAISLRRNRSDYERPFVLSKYKNCIISMLENESLNENVHSIQFNDLWSEED